MRIGVLGTAEVALRRFCPALMHCCSVEFAGIASRNPEKAVKFTDLFGGKIYCDYDSLLDDENIECVYIPLPPALHFEWAKKALQANKHVMLEKPFTLTLNDTKQLIDLAKTKELALHENYMFLYHSQMDFICNRLSCLGDIRIVRIDFGFPFRGNNDFRYNMLLGGGALYDCGGYPLKLASLILGNTARITNAVLGYKQGIEVDINGSATLQNDEGLVAQIAFGMDNSYRCKLDIWGSHSSLVTDRIFTAPDGFEPTVYVHTSDSVLDFKLECDNSFIKSIMHFVHCIQDKKVMEDNYVEIIKQAELLEQFKYYAKSE